MQKEPTRVRKNDVEFFPPSILDLENIRTIEEINDIEKSNHICQSSPVADQYEPNYDQESSFTHSIDDDMRYYT